MSRKVARLELFKIVFESEMNGVTPDTILENFLNRDEVILSKNDKEFVEKFVRGISENSVELDRIIEENMIGWEIDRIGSVEHALLKSAVYELTFEDTGLEIVVNEVVEIAKIYGDEKSFEFINGVLSNVINKNKK
ncbi:MAG: transcription antitermination factor NusB [Fusobacteriaceae bacterium]